MSLKKLLIFWYSFAWIFPFWYIFTTGNCCELSDWSDQLFLLRILLLQHLGLIEIKIGSTLTLFYGPIFSFTLFKSFICRRIVKFSLIHQLLLILFCSLSLRNMSCLPQNSSYWSNSRPSDSTAFLNYYYLRFLIIIIN